VSGLWVPPRGAGDGAGDEPGTGASGQLVSAGLSGAAAGVRGFGVPVAGNPVPGTAARFGFTGPVGDKKWDNPKQNKQKKIIAGPGGDGGDTAKP